MRALCLALLLTLVGCASAPPAVTPDAAIAAFTAAGLAAGSPSAEGALTPEVQTAAPSCAGLRFTVEGDKGGRVVVCSPADAEKLERYYVSLGESNAIFASHVHRAGGLVLQMNGSLPAETFAKYVEALPK